VEELEREAEPPGGWLTKACRWQWGDVEMDMTPMIDVTFQLLIFFMLTHALANPLPMDVPSVTYGRGVTVEGQQFILIDENGKYYLGYSAAPENATASLDALVQEVRQNARRSDTRLDVIVSAHRKCAHGQVRELVERLGAAGGLGRILLGVEEKMNR
jgi:biopolymer transport protein ExbD